MSIIFLPVKRPRKHGSGICFFLRSIAEQDSFVIHYRKEL